MSPQISALNDYKNEHNFGKCYGSTWYLWSSLLAIAKKKKKTPEISPSRRKLYNKSKLNQTNTFKICSVRSPSKFLLRSYHSRYLITEAIGVRMSASALPESAGNCTISYKPSSNRRRPIAEHDLIYTWNGSTGNHATSLPSIRLRFS